LPKREKPLTGMNPQKRFPGLLCWLRKEREEPNKVSSNNSRLYGKKVNLQNIKRKKVGVGG